MIYFTSDPHYGFSSQGDRAVEALAEYVANHGSDGDVLLLGGDLGGDDKTLQECLALFERFPGHKFAVPGNHDVWVESVETSFDRYRRLSEIFRAAGFHPLQEEPAVVGGVGFAGCMGWYDYSFRDEELNIPLHFYETKTYPGEMEPLWNDAGYARWGRDDCMVTEWQAKNLAQHLRSLRDVREVIVLTHHVPTKNLLVYPRELVPRRSRFANAFLGSERFAEVIMGYPSVRLAVCGHIHMGSTADIDKTRFLSIGSSYDQKELVAYNGKNITRQTFG